MSSTLAWADLVKVAQLLQLGAETARLYAEETADGQASRIRDLSIQITEAANELAQIGLAMDERL